MGVWVVLEFHYILCYGPLEKLFYVVIPLVACVITYHLVALGFKNKVAAVFVLKVIAPSTYWV